MDSDFVRVVEDGMDVVVGTGGITGIPAFSANRVGPGDPAYDGIVWCNEQRWECSLEQAVRWQEYLWENTYFITAMMFATVVDGKPGCMLLESTRQSTRMQACNAALLSSGQRMVYPYWYFFRGWWYAGLTLLNFQGIYDPEYEGRSLPGGIIGRYLSEYVWPGIDWLPQWVAQEVDAYSYKGLVMLLQAQYGLRMWVDFLLGGSYFALYALDMYVRFMSPGQATDGQATWFVLNAQGRVDDRRLVPLELWYTCSSWQQVGQRNVFGMGSLSIVAAVVVPESEGILRLAEIPTSLLQEMLAPRMYDQSLAEQLRNGGRIIRRGNRGRRQRMGPYDALASEHIDDPREGYQ